MKDLPQNEGRRHTSGASAGKPAICLALSFCRRFSAVQSTSRDQARVCSGPSPRSKRNPKNGIWTLTIARSAAYASLRASVQPFACLAGDNGKLSVESLAVQHLMRYRAAGRECHRMNTARPARNCRRRTNQLPLIKAVPMRSGRSFCCARVLDQMMMEGDHPTRARILRAGNLNSTGLLRRDHSKRIGEGKMCVGVRIQQDDAYTVLRIGRQYHWKDTTPQLGQFLFQPGSSGIGKHGQLGEMWRQCRRGTYRPIGHQSEPRHELAHLGQRPSPTGPAPCAAACSGLSAGQVVPDCRPGRQY